MIALKQRAMEIAAAAPRNPSLARVLEDIYARIDGDAEEPDAPKAAKKPARRAAKKNGGDK